MSAQVYMIKDYETRSKGELKLIGPDEYSKHPSTRILCVAWALGTEEDFRNGTYTVHVWSPYLPSSYGEFKRALFDPNVTLVAHNAGFEQVITENVLPRYIHDPRVKGIPISRYMCTASMARAMALPAKLEHACAALKLGVQKDMEGHKLMMKMSKPRKPTKNDPSVWHCKVSQLKRLMEYCKTDIKAEIELFLNVPKLNPKERNLWMLDQLMNRRGFTADRALVAKALKLIAIEQKGLERETRELTRGKIESTQQRDAILKWVRNRGLALPNLQAKTVQDALAGRLPSRDVRRVLELRALASKTSTAKYVAFESRSRSDGRVRDNLIYHGASTGRFTGAGVQIHNLPRPTIKDTDEAAEIILDPTTDLDFIRMIWGSPLEVFASCLRSVIIADEGYELFSGDFSGIEVRVLFWLAGHEDGLRAYREGRDLYCEQAHVIYGRKITKADDTERDLGKRVVLGGGFGMGAPKFQATCAQWGSVISLDLAKTAIAAYRKLHKPVPQMWYNIEHAAIDAVRKPGKTFTVNKTSWTFKDNYLWCELPSGRKLAYYGARVQMKSTPWGEKRPVLYHWGIHPKTKQWVFSSTYGGRLTENVVQATARDLMTEAMPRLEGHDYKLLITVHDQCLCQRKKGEGSVKEFDGLMARPPLWARGLPIKVDAWVGARFKK